MKDIRNLNGRKICSIDPSSKTVVIVTKGIETKICFNTDGTYNIIERKITT